MVHPQSTKLVKPTFNCLFSLVMDAKVVSTVAFTNLKIDLNFEAKMLNLMGKHSSNFSYHLSTVLLFQK